MEALYQEAIRLHQAGKLKEAKANYDAILSEYPEHPHILYLAGVTSFGLKNYKEAKTHLYAAIKQNPNHPNSRCCLAHTLIELGEEDAAVEHYQKAFDLDPQYVEAVRSLAQLLDSKNRNAEAIDAFCSWLAIDNQNAYAFARLADLYATEGILDKADLAIANALEIAPESIDTLIAQGRIACKHNDLKTAERAFRKALEKDDSKGAVHYNLGLVFHQQGKMQWAYGAFESAVTRDKQLSDAHFMLAKCAIKLRHDDKGTEHLNIAESQGFKHLEIPLLRAKIKSRSGELRAAIIILQNFLIEEPDHVPAYIQLGTCFNEQKKFDRSIEVFKEALKIDPDHKEVLLGLSHVCREAGGDDKNENMNMALETAILAFEKYSDDPRVHFNMGNLYMDFGLPHLGVPHVWKAVKFNPSNRNAESTTLFNANYLPELSAEELFKKHKSWGDRYLSDKPPANPDFKNKRDAHKKLRIGYISPDFCVHPVAYFFKPVFEAHDREHFEYYCYYNNYSKSPEDVFTKVFKEGAAVWRDIAGMDLPAIAELIKNDEVDILVDLAGHSCGHKLPSMARRPAPVQVSWLGYPNTTGAPGIQWRFSDAIVEPECDDKISTERIYRLPNGFNCYHPPYTFPEVAPLPALKNGYISFGSFNNSCKHNAKVLETWAKILKQVPNSRLVIKDKYLRLDVTRDFVYGEFAKQGIGMDRIEILPFQASNKDHVSLYSQIDIALDPFPYNGTTTTCEALYMGVPVVTFLGDRHAARVTASINSRLGLDDWIGENHSEYIDLAVKKAQDIDTLEGLRKVLRDRFHNSTVYDANITAKDIENAYRDMWTQWCEKPQ